MRSPLHRPGVLPSDAAMYPRGMATVTSPLCQCHGEPMYWHKDKTRSAGGRWRCAVKVRERAREHRQSAKGRAAIARWRRSGKHRASQARYRRSEKGRATDERYNRTEKRKVVDIRYERTEKGKAARDRDRWRSRLRDNAADEKVIAELLEAFPEVAALLESFEAPA